MMASGSTNGGVATSAYSLRLGAASTIAMLLIPPLLWAGNIVVGRAIGQQVPPFALSLARQVVAFMAILPFGLNVMRRDLPLYWLYRWQVIKLAASGLVIFNSLVYLGLHKTTASNAQLLNSSIPLLIVLFNALILGDRLSTRQAIGIGLSLVGVCTIIFAGDLGRLIHFQLSVGDLLVFLGMASFALFSIWLRSFPASINRLGLLGAQIFTAILILMPLAVLEHCLGNPIRWSIGGVEAMVYVGAAAGMIANLLYMAGVARVGPARAGVFIHLVPLYGVVISSLLLNESLRLYQVVGIVAILGGLALSSIKPGRDTIDPRASVA